MTWIEPGVDRSPDIETKWTAIALLYGPPPDWWLLVGTVVGTNKIIPLNFRIVLEKFFHPEEVRRIGLRRMAYDYAHWYEQNHT